MIGMRSTWFVILAAAGALALVVGWLVTPQGSGEVRARLSLTESMGTDDHGEFDRAVGAHRFLFPADHGPHPGFRTEWWYFTGSLESAGGREIGYQLTFFGSGLSRGQPRAVSAWSAARIFMGHVGLTDLGTGTFHSRERFSRATIGLAGATSDPLRVWLEDWSMTAGREPGSFILHAATPELVLDLELVALRPIVLHGDEGLSRKGSEPGNASYYYSITRLQTSGRIDLDGQPLAVRGLSWMDHEWSTSALERGQRGWDWFALQLDDGTDLMLYRLRRDDGVLDTASSGTLIEPGGAVHRLTADSARIDVDATWVSAATRAHYPAGWTLRIPAHDLSLVVVPRLADQEHDLSIPYWEGMVTGTGSSSGRSVSASGYAELTGYAPDLP